MSTFDAVDLFAGPGGWDVAAAAMGVRSVGLEWDAAACATRAAAGHPTIRCDVAAYPTAPLAGTRGLIGSPPCQGFSRAGKRGSISDLEYAHQAVHDLAHGRDTRARIGAACSDPRTVLVAEPVRYAEALRPEWIALEQVPDVLPIWRQTAELLRGWGYSAWTGVLNAADYGVPQTRRRAILVASRVHTVTAPSPTHTQHPAAGLFGDDLLEWVSMADALGWPAGQVVNTRGERRTPGGNEFPADRPSWALAEKTRSWVLRSGQSVAGEGRAERPADEPSVTITGRADLCAWVLRSGNQPNAAIRGGHEPAPTMAFGNNAARVEWIGREPEPVRITEAEAAVLQGFPADYPWVGTKTKRFEQIGNAVPPPLAAEVLAAAAGLPAAARPLEAAA